MLMLNNRNETKSVNIHNRKPKIVLKDRSRRKDMHRPVETIHINFRPSMEHYSLLESDVKSLISKLMMGRYIDLVIEDSLKQRFEVTTGTM